MSTPPYPQRTPAGAWTRARLPADVQASLPTAVPWSKGRLFVLSDMVEASLPDGSGRVGPHWFVSVSVRGGRRRAADSELRLVRVAFGMPEGAAEEDNHHPGIARHLWMPVAPAERRACSCKADETQMHERDGYTWSNTKTGGCRGCEYRAVFGRPCPIHSPKE